MRCALAFMIFSLAQLSHQLLDWLTFDTSSRGDAGRLAYGPCDPEPSGYGPKPSIDTPAEFMNYTPFYTTARIAPTPLGYDLVGQALAGSVYGNVFRGVQYMTSYDPVSCAGMCNDISYCTSFNIYYERDPLLTPDCDKGCRNPNSTTHIKCVFWGSSISQELALNRGETRCEFRVIIAGSNYYVKQDALHNLTNLGFFGPRGDALDDAVFPASEMIEPVDQYSTFIGSYYGRYTDRAEGPNYDPAACAQKCNALSSYNSVNKVNSTPYINGAYPRCNMFTIYETKTVNGIPFSTVCLFFSSSWDSKYSTKMVGQDKRGRNLTVSMVKTYQRLDYSDPPICDLTSCTGAQYYRGGDCSGWGTSYC